MSSGPNINDALKFEVGELAELFIPLLHPGHGYHFIQIVSIDGKKIRFIKIDGDESQFGKQESCILDRNYQLIKLSPLLSQKQQDSLVKYTSWLMKLVISIRG